MKLNLLMPYVKEAKDLRDRLNSVMANLATRLAYVDEQSEISGTSTSTFTEVSHNLGAVPDFIHIEPKAEVAWWVTDGDRANWTTSKVYLHFSAASVNFTGYVSRLEH